MSAGAAAEAEVTENESESRYEIRLGDELAGFVTYERSPGKIDFRHTEVDARFEGHGIGSKLAHTVLDRARAQGLGVIPTCPFIRGWIRRHPEYRDLVAR